MRRKASLSVSSFFEKQKRASESVMWRWPKEKKADDGALRQEFLDAFYAKYFADGTRPSP